MTSVIRDVMTPNPRTLDSTATAEAAAGLMRDEDVGAVIVVEDDRVLGVVTDRDLVVRVMAAGKNPSRVKQADICSSDVVTVSPDDSIDTAVRLMRDRALRRLPVVENGRAVGIVSIGDLAQARDPDSALADVSAAPANR
jgi:CBS domain-containing protein